MRAEALQTLKYHNEDATTHTMAFDGGHSRTLANYQEDPSFEAHNYTKQSLTYVIDGLSMPLGFRFPKKPLLLMAEYRCISLYSAIKFWLRKSQ